MKIIISCTADQTTAAMDMRFGRCAFFAVYDSLARTYDFIENKANQEAQGAGISAAQKVVALGADVLMTGRLGPKASQIIENSSIRVVLSQGGSVEECIASYIESVDV